MKLIPTFKSEKTSRNCKWCMFFWSMLIIFWSVESIADEVVFKFKSPSFSGVGTSSHYLTIQNQEFNRKEALKAEIKALQDQIERDKENTTLARFIRNLELEGNRIEYSVVDGIITLNITDSDGNTTTISLPIGSFTF
jgi:hypothetical protein